MITPEHFLFVIAWHTNEDDFEFTEYTPEEFIECSTIPPFKIYFKVEKNGIPKVKHKSALAADKDILRRLVEFDNDLRKI